MNFKMFMHFSKTSKIKKKFVSDDKNTDFYRENFSPAFIKCIPSTYKYVWVYKCIFNEEIYFLIVSQKNLIIRVKMIRFMPGRVFRSIKAMKNINLPYDSLIMIKEYFDYILNHQNNFTSTILTNFCNYLKGERIESPIFSYFSRIIFLKPIMTAKEADVSKSFMMEKSHKKLTRKISRSLEDLDSCMVHGDNNDSMIILKSQLISLTSQNDDGFSDSEYNCTYDEKLTVMQQLLKTRLPTYFNMSSNLIEFDNAQKQGAIKFIGFMVEIKEFHSFRNLYSHDKIISILNEGGNLHVNETEVILDKYEECFGFFIAGYNTRKKVCETIFRKNTKLFLDRLGKILFYNYYIAFKLETCLNNDAEHFGDLLSYFSQLSVR